MLQAKKFTPAEALKFQRKVVTCYGRNPFVFREPAADDQSRRVPASNHDKLEQELNTLLARKLALTRFEMLTPSVRSEVLEQIKFYLKLLAFGHFLAGGQTLHWQFPRSKTSAALSTTTVAGIGMLLSDPYGPVGGVGFGIFLVSACALAWMGRRQAKACQQQIAQFLKENPLWERMDEAVRIVLERLKPIYHLN